MIGHAAILSTWIGACRWSLTVLARRGIVASLIPAGWQIRTGLHWLVEHFLVYFLVTSMFCLAWPRPFVVAGVMMPFAVLLEALQGLTPDRTPDLPTALAAAAGVARRRSWLRSLSGLEAAWIRLIQAASLPLARAKPNLMYPAAMEIRRRRTIPVKIGGVMVGGRRPVVVQSMTNTDTADIECDRRAGRGACPRGLRARAHHRGPRRRPPPPCRISASRLDARGVEVPLVGDFHYNGHTLLAEHPACAEALAKYRINPGNVGFKDKRDRQFAAIVEIALRNEQAGAHRRELGEPRPGSAHPADGRERASCLSRRMRAR